MFNKAIRFESHYGQQVQIQIFAMKTRGIIAFPILSPIQN